MFFSQDGLLLNEKLILPLSKPLHLRHESGDRRLQRQNGQEHAGAFLRGRIRRGQTGLHAPHRQLRPYLQPGLQRGVAGTRAGARGLQPEAYFQLQKLLAREGAAPVFPEKSTQNLLDYAGGTELWKYQWDLIHDPETVWFNFLQGEEEGAMSWWFYPVLQIIVKTTGHDNAHYIANKLNLSGNDRYCFLFYAGAMNSVATQFDVQSVIDLYEGATREWIATKPWELTTFGQKSEVDIIKGATGPIGIIAYNTFVGREEIIADIKKFFDEVSANDPYAVGQLTGFTITLLTPAGETAGATKVMGLTKASLKNAAGYIKKASALGLRSRVAESVLTFTDDAGKALLAVEKVGDELVCKGEMLATAGEKLWTKVDDFDGLFNGKPSTYYDVSVTYQIARERVGVAFIENDILEFHLNIPEKLQKQGIGSEVFKKAIQDYAPSKIKGWWKKSDIYSGEESVNLTIFKEKVAGGMSPIDAAFETPTGKILKANGFDGIPEIIKNTLDEVIIHFNPSNK
ncbi:MAG: hypothetical protein QM786_00420 [Breznakibacter sp.]